MADQTTIQYYDSHADSYGAVTPYGNFVTYREKFSQMLAPGSKVLDLGCGGGHASAAFLEEGFEVVALDGSTELAKVASQRIGAEVVVKDFYELDYCSEFDGIWAAASLTHVPLPELSGVLSLVHNAIRERGLLVASFKVAERDWRDTNDRLFGGTNLDSLQQSAEAAGFKIGALDVVAGSGRTEGTSYWIWMIATPKAIA